MRVVKCEVCNRKFKNVGLLQMHKKHYHQKTMPTKRLRNTAMNEKPIDVPKIEPESEADSSKATRHNFQCSKCTHKFITFSTAYRHIERFHGNDKDAKKIIPIPLKENINVKIQEPEVRTTPEKSLPQEQELVKKKTSSRLISCNKFQCLGCEQMFTTWGMFEVHLKGLHGDKIISFFLKDLPEFQVWKASLQIQTKTNYVMLNKFQNKQVYHCVYHPEAIVSDITRVCPATIISQQLPTGLQVTYYNTHGAHKVEPYNVPQRYNKNEISKFLTNAEDIDVPAADDDKDIYLQFKRVMSNIVTDAAKINISTLKVLLSKALAMTSVLNSYDEDDEGDVMSKRMTEAQIIKALEESKGKRKAETLPEANKLPEAKKVKIEEPEVNNENDETVDNVTKKTDVVPPAPVSTPAPVKPIVNQPIVKPSVPIKMIQSPTSFNDSYKTFVDQNFKCLDTPTPSKKKEIVKTKIGQFKPSPPQLVPHKFVMPKITKVWHAKPDIKYEVKEQENDCNILILKI